MALPLLALIIGIILSPCLDPASLWISFPLAILVSLHKRWFALVAVALLGGLVGFYRTPAPPPDFADSTAKRVVGKLLRAPEWRGPGVYLDLDVQSVDEQKYRGRARLTEFLDGAEQRNLFESLELGSGDRVEVVVKLTRPGVYRNPGVFDYRRHLERQGIYWTGNIRNPRLITVLDRGWHGPDRLKRWVESRLKAPFENRPDIQGLVLGMVIGRKSGLTPDVERQFQAGGLYHLVVVSGFNLAVVAAATLWLARFVPCKRHTRLALALVSTLAYAAIVEGQAPVYRAAVAVLFLVAGKLLDRTYAALNAAAGAAFLLLLYDPLALEDSSFQMTFGAVLSVVGIGVPASEWLLGWLRQALKAFDDPSKDGDLPVRVADWRVSRRVWCELHGLPPWVITVPWTIVRIAGEGLIVSAAVEMSFAYFMVESFHRLSPLSALINVPAGMIAAAVTPLTLLLVLLPYPASSAAAWVVTALLDILLGILRLALELPASSLRVPAPPAGMWVAYGLLVGLTVFAIQRRRSVVCITCCAAVFVFQAVIALKDFAPRPPQDVTLTFLDVGQGDAALIEFPSGYRMLIDGGGVSSGRFLDLRDESTFSIGENVVSPYLFSRGLRRLDAVVLTHAHHDHMDGLFSVIENFAVGEVWLGRNPMSPRYRQWIERVQEKQIPIRWLSAGQQVGQLKVLHPPADWIPKRNGQNNDSVVLLLDTGRTTALLTGDIEAKIAVPESVDVLKVSHHGSKGVRIRPKAAVRVISVGANNPFGHPNESALPALRTDRLGAITVRMEKRPKVTLTERGCSCKLAFLFQSH